MNYKMIAREILNQLGGKENVSAGAHWATHYTVNDETKINQKELESMDVVKGTF